MVIGAERAFARDLEFGDIDRVARKSGGCDIFSDAFASIRNDETLIRRLAKYIHFNAVFGSGVASLAGAIGARVDLFREPAEPIAGLADRSTEIARTIFFAAVEEFGGTSVRCPTHRAMAQDLLRSVACYFDRVPPGDIAAGGVIAAAVCEGYGVGRRLDEAGLFGAVGFHLGSELLADHEFSLLDNLLRSRYPNLVLYLEQTRTRCGHPAYLWVRLHTTVEADHFGTGLRGANRALDFYAGAASRAAMRDEVLEGAGRFAELQAEFMRTIVD